MAAGIHGVLVRGPDDRRKYGFIQNRSAPACDLPSRIPLGLRSSCANPAICTCDTADSNSSMKHGESKVGRLYPIPMRNIPIDYTCGVLELFLLDVHPSLDSRNAALYPCD